MAAVSVVEDAAASRVCASTIDSRKAAAQRCASTRDKPGCRCCCIRRPARAVPGSRHGRHRLVGSRGPDARGRRRRAPAGGDRRVGPLHAGLSRGRRRSSLGCACWRPMRAATCARAISRYDVIVSDNFHPARSGSGSLYTVEHFEAVRRRLDAGRRLLPVAAAASARSRDTAEHRAVVHDRLSAGLGHAREQQPGDAGARSHRACRSASRFDAGGDSRSRVARGAAWAGSPASGSRTSSPCSAASSPGRERCCASRAAPPPTPTIIRWSPTARRASPTRPTRSPRDRLIALLRELSHRTRSADSPHRRSDASLAAALAAYWLARDRFIESGRDVRPSPRVDEMLAQVTGPLLSVLRISPDFRPAYDPLLSMATTLARSDASGARALLTELARIQPARAEATEALA